MFVQLAAVSLIYRFKMLEKTLCRLNSESFVLIRKLDAAELLLGGI